MDVLTLALAVLGVVLAAVSIAWQAAKVKLQFGAGDGSGSFKLRNVRCTGKTSVGQQSQSGSGFSAQTEAWAGWSTA
jgi:hypothetical protein